MSLSKFIRRLRSIDEKGRFKLINIVNSQRNEIIKKNKENLAGGKLSTGGDITNLNDRDVESTGRTNSYSSSYLASREVRAKKKQTEYVDLRLTGQYYKSIKYQKTPRGGKISSNDPKEKYIDERYGEDTLGLQEEQLQEIAEKSAEMLSQYIVKQLTNI